ncbi:hypothetical protein BD414DRAFT_475812 [Trametes punicea]|nr:hypothetical protein BD414DRAFT_475812 [Trametes punicea]
MSSDVAIDSGEPDSPLSSLSSPSQSSESSSAAVDRVFFGPVRSPEKRFARRAGSAPFRTPVRRSTRLSTARVPLPRFPQHQLGASASREGTPDEDGLQDEPSIVLANRVLSASGNPSPPPSPPLSPQTNSSTYMDVQLLDISNSTQPQSTPTATSSCPLIPVEGVTDPDPPLAVRQSTPTPCGLDAGNTSQPDLITFDSFSASNEDGRPTATEARDQKPPSAQPPTSTVDDLLSMSPHSPPPGTSGAEISDYASMTGASDNATSPQEEMEVADSLIFEVEPSVLSIPTAASSEAKHEDTFAVAVELSEDTNPPLRRSTRPRQSRSSLSQTVGTPSNPPNIAAEGLQETINITAEQSQQDSRQDFQTSPVRKRKLHMVPSLPEVPANSNTVGSPRRLPRVELARRDLGSLSPVSAAVLQQLLPGTSGESVSRSTTPQPQEGDQGGQSRTEPAPTTPPVQAANLIFPEVGPQVDRTTVDIQRPRSPLRPFPPTPFKLDDVARTPARRVPVAQAIAEGTYSAQKLPALFSAPRPTGAPGSPVFKRLGLDDLARSPARRVPVSEGMLPSPQSPGKGKEVVRPASPARPVARERQRGSSVEPRPLLGRKERGASAEPTTRPPALGRRSFFQKPASSDGVPSSSTLARARTTLPFPLVPTQRTHPAIPEADEPESSALHPSSAGDTDVRPKASPLKGASSLRQPSAGAGSKIPRIGAKPYARPKAPGKADTAPSKLPAPKPLHIVNVGSSSSGNSSDEGHGNAPSASKPSRRQALAPPPSEVSNAHGHNRRREPEAAKHAPTTAQPPILFRKVVPGMFNKGENKRNNAAPASSSSTIPEQASAKPLASASPAKAFGPIRARSAANWKRPQPEGQPAPTAALPSPLPPVPATAKSPTPEPAARPVVTEVQVPVGQPSLVEEIDEPPPVPPLLPGPTQTEGSPELFTAGTSAGITEVEGQPARQHRRSTRSKRSQEGAPTSDVFGTVALSSGSSRRPLQHRRKPGPLPSANAGMSALALKALTNANTLKNQQQVAVLKTEVIRKEGVRPDSPTTKVRTALERQREERAQQRNERAQRRARRSAGEDDIQSTGDGRNLGAAEPETDVDASFMSVERDADGVPLRHRRGPGDEEDYETPPRPERPAKRARFDGAEAEAEERELREKRVKWDKGLHTTVFLDDSPPRPKRNKQTAPAQKSCLTAAAKAMQLDMLGNVLNAEMPVGGLVRENVVVKKFVFDDDVEPEVASPAPLKSTRTKAKKSKS